MIADDRRQPGESVTAAAGPGRLQHELADWDGRLKRFPYATGVLLAAVAIAAYAKSLTGGFVYDDQSQILLNPFVTNPHLWTRIFAGSVWSFQGVGAAANFYRPLQFFCYWLLYRILGPEPAIFHLLSVVIYTLTVLLVYRLGVLLTGGPGRPGVPGARIAAFGAALLWAVHPLHVEAAAWVSALPDLGCGFFFLLAFLLFVRAEQAPSPAQRRHLPAAAAYLPALFFKETALTLPLVLAAYWVFAPSAVKRGWARQARVGCLYLAPVAVYLAARRHALGHFSHAAHLWRITPQVAGAALGLLGQHLRLFLWPARLSAFRTFEIGPSLRSPWPWLAVALLVLGAACRRRRPLASFLLWWWFLTLLPCLDVRQLSVPLLADRFSYLPSVGLCLALSWVAMVEIPARFEGRGALRLAAAGLAALALAGAAVTVRDVGHWHDEESLLAYSLQAAPDAPAVHQSRAVVLEYRRADYDGAEREYRRALELNRSSLRPNRDLEYACTLGLGRIALHRRDVEAALAYDEAAVRLRPGLSPAYDALGVIYFPARNYARATPYFEQAARANPLDLGALFYLGTCYLKLGRYREAAAQFRAITVIDPSFREAYEQEARALAAAGDPGAAAAVREKAPAP
ncbi:MAG TPA: tetratricopeptide repeat protein [Terriglobia bacterium]|nr:tetratricopeptide repeat protein [Terriglobia bacterium]